MTGWVKLHRETLNNSVIMKDSEHLAVWVYLLLNACYEVCRGVFGGEVIELGAGELLVSQRQICRDLKIDKSKVSRILSLFKSEELIKTRTDRQKTLVSIELWDTEQRGNEIGNDTGIRQEKDTEQEREKEKEKSSKREKEKEKEIYNKERRKEAPTGRVLYDLRRKGDLSSPPTYGDADEFFALAVARSYEDDDDEPLDTSGKSLVISH